MASIKRIGKDSLGVPIWDVQYRRTKGKASVHRRIHAKTRAEVERAILLDSNRTGAAILWSEGMEVYLKAKAAEGKTAGSMENSSRAANKLIGVLGDIAIEDTTPEAFKDFMGRCSTPKVANHHRRELLAVANYLKRHAGKVATVPFADVPPLPVKVAAREPIPADRLVEYLDALPPHIRRPIQMVLFYGLRSTSICNLTLDSIEGEYLNAIDKGGVQRRIPFDGMLRSIVDDAIAWRNKTKARGRNLFVNSEGGAWERTNLLRASQRAWSRAGLDRKKIHEVRHTLGTLAGRSFAPGMVQAAMGHRSRQSSAAYFHPTEEMAAEVRQKIVSDLFRDNTKDAENTGIKTKELVFKNGEYHCPCCGVKLCIPKRKPANR